MAEKDRILGLLGKFADRGGDWAELESFNVKNKILEQSGMTIDQLLDLSGMLRKWGLSGMSSAC